MADAQQNAWPRRVRRVLIFIAAALAYLGLASATLLSRVETSWGTNEWAWFLVGFLLTIGTAALISIPVWRRIGLPTLGAKVVAVATFVGALVISSLNAVGVPKAALDQSPALRTASDNLSIAQLVILTIGFIGVAITATIAYQRQANDEVRLGYELTREQHQRYSEAAEMLAHDSPVMRLAGLAVLKALAMSEPKDVRLRAACINLVCSFLRVTSIAGTKREWENRAGQDKVVIEQAVQLLPTLLRKRDEEVEFGPQAHYLLDLRGTTLPELRLSDCLIGGLLLNDSLVVGPVVLEEATFGFASVEGTEFHDPLELQRAEFNGPVLARRARFNGGLLAAQVTMRGDLDLSGSIFYSRCDFAGLTVTGVGDFSFAQFCGESDWEEASLSQTTSFWGAEFHSSTDFNRVQFLGFALFAGTRFRRRASFQHAKFWRGARFDSAHFLKQARDDEGLASATFVPDPTHPFPGAVYLGDDAQAPLMT